MATTYVGSHDKAECLSPGGGGHIEIFADGDSDLEGVESGDFVRYAQIYGVALTDYNADVDSFVMELTGGHELTVTGENNAGNIAVDIGDWLYWDDSPELINKDVTNGVPIGIALEALASGGKAAICVLLIPQSP